MHFTIPSKAYYMILSATGRAFTRKFFSPAMDANYWSHIEGKSFWGAK